MRPLQDLFRPADYPDLLVGLAAPDDAAVWRLDEHRALVVTTDFFTPIVDDAYDYGAIAAANALSDLYAMGARPILALNVAAVPPDLPVEIISEILRGGRRRCARRGRCSPADTPCRTRSRRSGWWLSAWRLPIS